MQLAIYHGVIKSNAFLRSVVLNLTIATSSYCLPNTYDAGNKVNDARTALVETEAPACLYLSFHTPDASNYQIIPSAPWYVKIIL